MKFFAFSLSSLLVLILLPLMTASVEYDVTLFAGGISGYADGIGTNAKVNSGSIRISPNGLFAILTDSTASFIRKVDLSTASVTTFAGGPEKRSEDITQVIDPTPGIGTNSKFYFPSGVSISPDNSYALVADTANNLIRHIDLSSVFVSTFAGVVSPGYADGVGTNSAFDTPNGVAISPDGLYALVSDACVIRHIDLSTVTVTTLAGSQAGLIDGIGTNSNFYYPKGIAISADGSFALVADTFNYAIRYIDLSTVSVTTLAGGGGDSGSDDGQGTNALILPMM
jgi:hypothetical protein